MATALQASGGDTSAAEAVEHWAAAGRTADELPAGCTQPRPPIAYSATPRPRGTGSAPSTSTVRSLNRSFSLAWTCRSCTYVRCLNALQAAGEYEHFGALATEAYARYAEHSNPMIAALVQLRLAESRWHGSLADFREPLEQALRLFEELPPSADHARA